VRPCARPGFGTLATALRVFLFRASDTNIFKSKVLDTDDRYSYTFTKPGTYLYYCTVHPKMTAKVVVQ
jgi:plastocyanin